MCKKAGRQYVLNMYTVNMYCYGLINNSNRPKVSQIYFTKYKINNVQNVSLMIKNRYTEFKALLPDEKGETPSFTTSSQDSSTILVATRSEVS